MSGLAGLFSNLLRPAPPASSSQPDAPAAEVWYHRSLAGEEEGAGAGVVGSESQQESSPQDEPSPPETQEDGGFGPTIQEDVDVDMDVDMGATEDDAADGLQQPADPACTATAPPNLTYVKWRERRIEVFKRLMDRRLGSGGSGGEDGAGSSEASVGGGSVDFLLDTSTVSTPSRSGSERGPTVGSETPGEGSPSYEVPEADLFDLPFLDTQGGTPSPRSLRGEGTEQVPPSRGSQSQPQSQWKDGAPETQDLPQQSSPSTTLPWTPLTEANEEGRRGRSGCGRRPGTVPHETETTGAAVSVSGISMRCRTVNVGLCRVVGICPLRRTDRMDSQQRARAADKGGTWPSADGLRMLSCSFDGFDDDGPLSTIYRHVLSLELVEVVDEEKEEANEKERRIVKRAASAFRSNGGEGNKDEVADDARLQLEQQEDTQRLPKRRVVLFLYGRYATRMSRLLEEWKYQQTNKTSNGTAGAMEELLVSLRDVPARCVLPYYAQRTPSVATETACLNNVLGRRSRYCICIGSKSHMYIANDSDHEPITKLRFDSADYLGASFMDMRAVVVRKSGNMVAAGGGLASPAKASSEQVENDDMGGFTSTDEATLSWATVSGGGQPSEESEATDAYPLAQKYVDIVSKREAKQQRLMNGARGDDGGTRNVEENANEREASLVARQEGGEPNQEKPARKPRKLRYHSLSDAQHIFDSIRVHKQEMQTGKRAWHKIDDAVNVYGVALSSSAPKLSKRGDWCLTIHLIDESLPELIDSVDNNANRVGANNVESTRNTSVPSVTLLIFSRDISRLPIVRHAGDIVRAHRVRIEEWNGLQLCGGRISSFLVARPRNERHMLEGVAAQGWVECHSAVNPTPLDDEIYARMKDLWRWGQKRIASVPTINSAQQFTISSMGGQDSGFQQQVQGLQMPSHQTVCGDLIAMVTAMIPVPAEQISDRTPRAFLRLWDGTGSPSSDPMPVDSLVAMEAIRNGDPPSSAVSSISSIISSFSGEGNSIEASLEPPKSLCGRVVNAVIWEPTMWNLLREPGLGLAVGNFVRFRNINDGRLSSGLRCLMINQYSQVSRLPIQTYEIKSLLLAHGKRICSSTNPPYNPSSGVLPLSATAQKPPETLEVNVATAPGGDVLGKEYGTNSEIFSLAEVLGGPEESESASFLARFSVFGTYPEVNVDEADWLPSLCVLNEEGGPNAGETVYQFVLRLRDDSAEMDAFVMNNVAESLISVSAAEVCQRSRGGGKVQGYDTAVNNFKKILEKGMMWEGEIRSFMIAGEKFFSLQSVRAVPLGSHNEGEPLFM